MNDKKEYTGSVYIGVVGTSHIHVNASSSINAIHRWAGDGAPYYLSATKGFEARQSHINNFIDSKHDFMLLLDHDQTFPADTLDRLRSHKLPYVSGLYMFRSATPRPIWFKWQKKNEFPFVPYYEIPERGKLVKLAASGWGCMLVHRDVVMAVRELLKDEKEITEDDMDVWPYDIHRIMAAIKMLEAAGEKDNVRSKAVSMLKEEIRPLRVVKDNIGSDLRFPFFAREAGFVLWGDPDVRCGHFIDYPVTPDDFEQMNPKDIEHNRKQFTGEMVRKEKNKLKEAMKSITNIKATDLIEAVENG